jgi:hypothetical protein
MTTTTTPTTPATRQSTFAHHASLALTSAFLLSIVHTIYVWAIGLGDPMFTVTTPTMWAFYVVGFGSAALVRVDRRWAAWTVAAYLAVLLVVSIVWYPTQFRPELQNVFGWFENDVYTALLVLALYLVVQRLRRISLR